MCKPASFVLTKTRAYWSEDGDSHEDIISEHSLHADGPRGPNIVRVEVVPREGNYAAPLDQWQYHVDQDVLPDWYDADAAESMARAALQEWARQHVFRGHLDEVRDGQTRILLESATVDTVRGGWVYAYNSATVETVSGGRVYAHGSATVKIVSGGDVDARDSATVKIGSGGHVYARDSTTVENVAGGGHVYARDSTTVENVAAGGWVRACCSATVEIVSGGDVYAYGSATVEIVSGGWVYTYDSATVKNDTRKS